jgi:hypothetical protein
VQYLYLKQARYHFFSFFLNKIGEQQGRIVPAQGGGGLVPVGGAKWLEKVVGG